MSASTPTAGYPVHRVTAYSRWTNPHGVTFTDWTAACEVTGTITGNGYPTIFGTAGQARRAELCRTCFPRGDWHAPPGVHWSDPADMSDQ